MNTVNGSGMPPRFTPGDAGRRRRGPIDTVGTVVFVGAGPGAADLITLRGAAALARADVVLCDALADPALRAHAPHAVWIDVGKRGFTGARTSVETGGSGSVGQTTINALLVKHAFENAVVVRLKGGDPSIFGRLEEEIEALNDAGIGWEIVPGVTAALAAAAASGRPLTRRGVGRSVVLGTAMTRADPVAVAPAAAGVEPTATDEPEPAAADDLHRAAVADLHPAAAETSAPAAAENLGPAVAARVRPAPSAEAGPAMSTAISTPTTPPADTAVVYMAGRQLGTLGRRLAAVGWAGDTPVSVVSNAGWPDALQSEHTVTTLARASVVHAGRPTVVVVGVGATPLRAAAETRQSPPPAARADSRPAKAADAARTGAAAVPPGAAAADPRSARS